MNPLRWVSDTTRRFSKRPHYSPEQLDAECERIVSEFLLDRYRHIVFPITTDDLEIAIKPLVMASEIAGLDSRR